MARSRFVRWAVCGVVALVVAGASRTASAGAMNAMQAMQAMMAMQPMMAMTAMSPSGFAGVVVDAKGVLRTEMHMDGTGQLTRQRIAAARAKLNPKIAAASPLRKISLNRLEAAIKQKLADGQKPDDEMKSLAGLTRVQYVFFYPETRDIVLAGPAEGWAADITGRVRGMNSGKPAVELDDLVTALRAFPPGGKQTSVIGCSIDPTQEGLKRMQDFLKSIGSRATPGDTQFIVTGLRESLGLQNVRIMGVPATTHFAQVLVEADYRMKLIGIGLERMPVKQFVSYVDKASPTSVSRNAMQRWFFVPNYECLRVTADGQGMELVGDGVKLVNADEIVNADGTRAKSGTTDAASKMFTESFTKKYADVASVAPVYAQMRNCIDLAVAAAFIQQKDYYSKAGWSLGVFADEAAYPVENLNAPQQVETTVASIWKGNRLMTPIGGGVHIEPRQALSESNLLADEEGKVAALREKLDLKALAKDQWWWD